MGLFNKKELRRIQELEQELNRKDILNKTLQKELTEKTNFISSNDLEDSVKRKNFIAKLEEQEKSLKAKINSVNTELALLKSKEEEETLKEKSLSEEVTKKENTLSNLTNKIKNMRSYFNLLKKAESEYYALSDSDLESYTISIPENEEFNELMPTVEIKLNCMDQKDLRKQFKENDAKIDALTEAYEKRYTTKTNKALYKLMVLGLRAELQNILAKLKFGTLDEALDGVSELCRKYNMITAEGNQSVAKTLIRFIVEIEELFKNAVRIEYQYYLDREKARAEQAAIKEQMRQEAEERKELERQKKQMEKEENKFTSEIEKVKEQILVENDEEAIKLLQEKIAGLEAKLSNIAERKEEIVNRQNGKAGNVYVISNLGSFGEDVFKVGMTRRMEPMDRIKELSNASVPFEFDVHAMIFSEDAVSLESKLHEILNDYRLNKVNLRKEFFKLPLDEIEKVVLQEDPAASFNRTMIALQYKQSQNL